MGPWAGYSPSLSISFLICKQGFKSDPPLKVTVAIKWCICVKPAGMCRSGGLGNGVQSVFTSSMKQPTVTFGTYILRSSLRGFSMPWSSSLINYYSPCAMRVSLIAYSSTGNREIPTALIFNRWWRAQRAFPRSQKALTPEFRVRNLRLFFVLFFTSQ